MGEYREENGIMKYSENPSKEAVAWQGYDAFVGMDNYRNEDLKAGTILVKMEPSGSGYFTTLEEYRKQNLDSNIISKGLQLEPWKKSEGEYLYRSSVTFWELTKDLEVAIGETAANKDYGEGGITQIYIAGYDGKKPENNKAINLLKKTGEEQLKNYVISEKEFLKIDAEHKQHVLKRNYFCHLRQKEKLIDLRNTTDNIYVKSDCRERIKEIDEKIENILTRLNNSYDMAGEVPSQTYDENIIYLIEKIEKMEKNKEIKEIEPEKEKSLVEINKNIMDKVSSEIKLINIGEENRTIENRNERINIDELRKSYENYVFVGIEKNKDLIKNNQIKISEINNEISDIDKKISVNTEILMRVKENFEKVERYRETYEKYESKKLFKGKYYEKNYNSIDSYRSAKEYLAINEFKSIESVSEKVKSANENLANTKVKKVEEKTKLEKENDNISKIKEGLEQQFKEYKKILKEIELKEKGQEIKLEKKKEIDRGFSR